VEKSDSKNSLPSPFKNHHQTKKKQQEALEKIPGLKGPIKTLEFLFFSVVAFRLLLEK